MMNTSEIVEENHLAMNDPNLHVPKSLDQIALPTMQLVKHK